LDAGDCFSRPWGHSTELGRNCTATNIASQPAGFVASGSEKRSLSGVAGWLDHFDKLSRVLADGA
jgi:hypothetical protein